MCGKKMKELVWWVGDTKCCQKMDIVDHKETESVN